MITDIISNTFKKINEIKNDKYFEKELNNNEYDSKNELINKFKLELKNTCDGLLRLQQTYRSDVTTTVKITLLIDKINTKINKI